MKYVMFIGRWQPVHNGHLALINEGALSRGENALIYIRDIPPNENNPFTTAQTKQLLEAAFHGDSRVRIMVGPDISAVRYGRGVGYVVEEVHLDKTIQAISATGIRSALSGGDNSWEQLVHPNVVPLLRSML